MLMYAYLECNRCKRFRNFVWQVDKTYKCPMCGKLTTLPPDYMGSAIR